jgi:hypothetical protein
MEKAPQRKTFDGKIFGLVSIPLHKTKKSSEERAERYRAKGFNARVTKYPKGYAVYVARK